LNRYCTAWNDLVPVLKPPEHGLGINGEKYPKNSKKNCMMKHEL